MGEIVAVGVARERYAARDAEELVRIEYDLLPAVGDPEEALRTQLEEWEARLATLEGESIGWRVPGSESECTSPGR